MSVQVTMSFASIDEVIAYFTGATAIPAPTALVPVELPEPAATEKKNKGGRPRKQAQPEVAQNTGSAALGSPEATPSPEGSAVAETPSEASGTPSPEPSDGAHVFTIDDVRAGLAAVNAKKGLEAARDVLKQFNAGCVSEVKEADFGAFVVACETAVA